jgi:ACS family hexuronate transporter-like MFS transporter
MTGDLLDFYKASGHHKTGSAIMSVISGAAYLCAWTSVHFLAPRMKTVEAE